jgi:heme A synthase
VAALLAGALLVAALRACPPGHAVRRGAIATACLMLTEALLGAGLVLFELVAHDASLARAVSTSLHLVNTFLLLAATAATAWWASGGAAPRRPVRTSFAVVAGAPLSAMLLVGTTGAVTALGDTLFPSASVAAGLQHDFSTAAPLLVRLRVIHPLLASATALLVLGAMGAARAQRPTRAVAVLSRVASLLAVLQVGAGLLDLVSLAPVPLQLVHLGLADLVWIALVLTAVAGLSAPATEAASPPPRPLSPPLQARPDRPAQ